MILLSSAYQGALEHAESMAAAGSLSHSPDAGKEYGENVAFKVGAKSPGKISLSF